MENNDGNINTLLCILGELRQLGMTGIKISFEDEGAKINEVTTMRYLTAVTGVELSVKIGGCEAKCDIINCIDLPSDTIVAPMIESSFAIEKYIAAIKYLNYKNKTSFNLETISGYSNIDNILTSINKENPAKIDSITFGRVDFCASLNNKRADVVNDECYNYVEEVFMKAKYAGLQCNLGGAITVDSIKFIQKLHKKNLLDFFETRYIIISTKLMEPTDNGTMQKIIYLSNLFELNWLKYLSNRYCDYTSKYLPRISMIENRVANTRVL